MLLPSPLSDPEVLAAANLAVAGLVGLAVGTEREWSGHATGPHARFAGVRTFFLLGLTGGAAGILLDGGWQAMGATLVAAAALLTVVAYGLAVRRDGTAIDGTTEAAALVVLALAVLAGLGHKALAGGTVAVVVLALREKALIQRLVQKVGAPEMRAALEFAVLALVILPLLPNRAYGPLGGINLRTLWSVVLLFSAISFGGYLARRAVGAARGYAITGLLGGLISSTAVTLAFARRSRTADELSPSLGLGVAGASAVLLPRVAAVSLVLNPALALALVPFLFPPAIVGAVLIAMAFRRRDPEGSKATAADDVKSPLGLGLALRMALAFQFVLMAIVFVRETWGNLGVLTSAFFVGLTDLDALTLAMTRFATSAEATHIGALSIAIGIMANTLFKLLLTVSLGTRRFRRSATGSMLLYGVAGLIGIWLGTR